MIRKKNHQTQLIAMEVRGSHVEKSTSFRHNTLTRLVGLIIFFSRHVLKGAPRSCRNGAKALPVVVPQHPAGSEDMFHCLDVASIFTGLNTSQTSHFMFSPYITCGFEHFIFIHIYSNFAFFPLKFIKACYCMLKGNNLKLTTFNCDPKLGFLMIQIQ